MQSPDEKFKYTAFRQTQKQLRALHFDGINDMEN